MKKLAIIVDLDETLCTSFDVPVKAGVSVLQQLDEQEVQVHYVTARTSVCRPATERFLKRHCLPGGENTHFCPIDRASREHKRKWHLSLGLELNVIASIGDSAEEHEAAEAAGVRFVEVDPVAPEIAWSVLAELIADAGGFKPG